MPRPQHPTPHLPGGTLQVPSAPQRLGPQHLGFLLPWMGSGQQQLQPQLVGRAFQQLRLQHLLPLGRAPRPLLPQRLLPLLRRVPQQTQLLQLQPQRVGLLVLGKTPQQLLPQHLSPLGKAPRQKQMLWSSPQQLQPQHLLPRGRILQRMLLPESTPQQVPLGKASQQTQLLRLQRQFLTLLQSNPQRFRLPYLVPLGRAPQQTLPLEIDRQQVQPQVLSPMRGWG